MRRFNAKKKPRFAVAAKGASHPKKYGRRGKRGHVSRYSDRRAATFGLKGADVDPVMVLDAVEMTEHTQFRIISRAQIDMGADRPLKVRSVERLIISPPSHGRESHKET